MTNGRKMLTIATGAIVVLVASASAQTVTLEQVIREVCTKSDSVKMMKETINKSNQIVRQNWASALPHVSATAAYLHEYGSPFASSSSGGSSSGSSSSAMDKKTAQPDTSALLSLGQYEQLTHIHDSISAYEAGKATDAMLSSLSKAQNSDIYTGSISFSQPIYTFGKIGTAISVANDFNKSAKASYARNMQTLQLGAVDMFFGSLMAQKKAEIAAHSFGRKKELNSFLERNFQNGSGSKAQVLKTRADLADQMAQTIVAIRDSKVARMNLNAMMGRVLTDSASLDTLIMLVQVVNMPLPAPDDAVKTALAERKDIKSIRFLAESNAGGAKIYKAMYFPTIAATGSAGYTKMSSGSALLNVGGLPSWTLGIGAEWTLFDGFANSAKAAQYTSDANKLEIAASTMEKMVEIEVRSAILECAAADSNMKFFEGNV